LLAKETWGKNIFFGKNTKWERTKESMQKLKQFNVFVVYGSVKTM
jgi:hypothetical protein